MEIRKAYIVDLISFDQTKTMSENLIQETIHDSKIISERIDLELSNAKNEIFIAMAWFTDFNLYNRIITCLKNNINVTLILSDRKENEKLDFDYFELLGATVIKVKNVGWGMMNQKFCVIDRELVITGSYNWTLNAKKNHENVLITNFPKTVKEYVDMFFNIQDRAEKINNGIIEEDFEDLDEEVFDQKNERAINLQAKNNNSDSKNQILFQEESLFKFSQLLDNIIASEIGSFDKEFLKNEAYVRAEENRGDDQVLPQVMNSLYSNFINEIEVIEEKKSRLVNKIDEQLKLSKGNVELRTENEINILEQNLLIEQNNLQEQLHDLTKEIEDKKFTISNNNNNKIPFVKEKISNLKEKINDLKLDFVKPPINKPLIILLGLMASVLLIYIFVFYSSVAYIFLFSKEDAKEAMLLGIDTKTAEVFNPNAITEIFKKGLGGILFLFLFVVIPLGLGIMDILKLEKELKENKSNFLTKYIKPYLGFILIIIVDAIIAFRVARNIDEVDYLTNVVNKRKELGEIILSENFFLVFILGTLGVYLFNIVINKLFEQFNKRNVTLQEEKTKTVVKEINDEIENYSIDIQILQEENNRIESELKIIENNKNQLNTKLQQLPIEINDVIIRQKNQLISFNEKIINLAEIYKSQIENDVLPISKSEMKNRVNIYMEGWSKYLYDIYSINIAEVKTSEAIRQCDIWLENLSLNHVKKKELKEQTLLQINGHEN